MIGPNEGDFAPSCPHCKNGLNLHQPDESSPDQLLATCDSCFRWFCLLELGSDGLDVLMIELPGKTMVEEALGRLPVDQR